MQSHLPLVFFASIVIVTFIGSATPKPYLREQGQPTYWEEHVDECKICDETEIICQRCAKETKSTIVYPMCCEGREAAREWCVKYITYGMKNGEQS